MALHFTTHLLNGCDPDSFDAMTSGSTDAEADIDGVTLSIDSGVKFGLGKEIAFGEDKVFLHGHDGPARKFSGKTLIESHGHLDHFPLLWQLLWISTGEQLDFVDSADGGSIVGSDKSQ